MPSAIAAPQILQGGPWSFVVLIAGVTALKRTMAAGVAVIPINEKEKMDGDSIGSST